MEGIGERFSGEMRGGPEVPGLELAGVDGVVGAVHGRVFDGVTRMPGPPLLPFGRRSGGDEVESPEGGGDRSGGSGGDVGDRGVDDGLGSDKLPAPRWRRSGGGSSGGGSEGAPYQC